MSMLVGYVDEVDALAEKEYEAEECEMFDEILPEDVPTGDSIALKYLSTLAVLQLDAILPNAVLKEQKPANKKTKNQKGFKRILIMEYHCPGIGPVRLTVGQKGSDGTKVQYCITAISAYL